MHRNAAQPATRRFHPPVKFQRKHQVRQLRLVIRIPRNILLLALQIVERNLPVAMRQGRHRHHPRVTGLQQVRNQQPRQREMPKMIRSKLPLKSVLRKFLGRQRHHSRIVDQDVERPGKLLRKASNRGQRSHIQIDGLGLRAWNSRLQPCERGHTLFSAAYAQQHMRSVTRQLQRRLIANTTVRASDQRSSAQR